MTKRVRRVSNRRKNFVISWKDDDYTIFERIATIFNFNPSNSVDITHKNNSSKFTSSTGARDYNSPNDFKR